MAKLDPLDAGMPKFEFVAGKPKPTFEEVTEAQEQIMKGFQHASDAALAHGDPVGYLLRFPVADGYALYRVSKARPLTIQHVPYMDGYAIPAAHIRGLGLADVLEQMKRERAWRAWNTPGRPPRPKLKPVRMP